MTPNSLEEYHCAGSFTISLLLSTTRMRSQLSGRVSSAAILKTNKQTNFRRVLFMLVTCLCNVCFVLLLFCVCVWFHVSRVHCGSALGPGTSRLPYYCAPLVCVLNGLGGLAVWWLTNRQTNKQDTVCRTSQVQGSYWLMLLLLLPKK